MDEEIKEANPDTLMLVLAYLPLLCLIPYFAKKEDVFIRWHAAQGLSMLFIFGLLSVFLMVFGCCTSVFGFGLVIMMFSTLLNVAYLIFMILGIVKATQGERYRFPVISDLADKFI